MSYRLTVEGHLGYLYSNVNSERVTGGAKLREIAHVESPADDPAMPCFAESVPANRVVNCAWTPKSRVSNVHAAPAHMGSGTSLASPPISRTPREATPTG